jgi:hypothetical protein
MLQCHVGGEEAWVCGGGVARSSMVSLGMRLITRGAQWQRVILCCGDAVLAPHHIWCGVGELQCPPPPCHSCVGVQALGHADGDCSWRGGVNVYVPYPYAPSPLPDCLYPPKYVCNSAGWNSWTRSFICLCAQAPPPRPTNLYFQNTHLWTLHMDYFQYKCATIIAHWLQWAYTIMIWNTMIFVQYIHFGSTMWIDKVLLWILW